MPRKAFVADLDAVSKQTRFGNITNVKTGADDGELVFHYHFEPNSAGVQISALIPDLSGYPKHHDFHVFASEDAPATVAKALESAPSFSGQSLFRFLSSLSNHLDEKSTSDSQTSIDAIDNDGESEMPDFQHFDGLEDSDQETMNDQGWDSEEDETKHYNETSRTTSPSANRKLRADLRALKDAGFKIGTTGALGTDHPCYLSVSCRIGKLGISEEAMEAWHLESAEYLILLVYYPQGYESLENFTSAEPSTLRSKIGIRIGVSNNYKVASVSEAQAAFNCDLNDSRPCESISTPQGMLATCSGFRETFISRPLNGLMNERFIAILKYRLAMELSWSGSEKLFEKTLGVPSNSNNRIDNCDICDSIPETLPDIVKADELTKCKIPKNLSFPLLAMQFLLRNFVRCTEFCLVCHCKLESKVEAIKPYVCDNPLCLFQYVNLGFGPSLEYEVVTQPFVVDLLISFCYSAAVSGALGSFPDGLGLNIPPPSKYGGHGTLYPYEKILPRPQEQGASLVKRANTEAESVGYNCRLDVNSNELLFDTKNNSRCPFRKGDWLMILADGLKWRWHCRVSETVLFPTVKLAQPIVLSGHTTAITKEELVSMPSSMVPAITAVTIYAYNVKFDDLDSHSKCSTILMLLDLLPSIQEMQGYLEAPASTSLSRWVERISPAALGVFRWIIASNRSCIMQVDQPKEPGDEKKKRRTEERVQGVPLWLQFRFAMGAPDKEQRFLNAIETEPESTYKSIFAWHGSALCNWHSIIREGLHFKQTLHGRAFGDGCYHAKDFSTSTGYSKNVHYSQPGPSGTHFSQTWPMSMLRISSAVALSEIVNAPNQFVSNDPYYVVSQLDWIQTRYLFVLPSSSKIVVEEETPLVNILKQDPARTPTGPNFKPISLPLTAIPKSRRPEIARSFVRDSVSLSGRANNQSSSSSKNFRPLLEPSAGRITNVDDDDAESVDTLPEDLEILLDPEDGEYPPKAKSKHRKPKLPALPTPKLVALPIVTDFEIGSIENLQLTAKPEYATPAASKRLQKDLRTLLATQMSHLHDGRLADLGWYVDPGFVERTDNLYQWIVQLHSFPLELPLAGDMKSAGMQSIVLEMRFHATYPFSPPFVRVIRPRFLPFQQGGGGHITAGGSICMDLLTSSGWTAVSDIESVLLQIRMAIMSTDPRPARLERSTPSAGLRIFDYGVGEAVEAYKRAASMHGWVIPEGLDEVAFATSGPAATR